MLSSLATFAISLMIFHASELALVWVYERESLSRRSLLLSAPYIAAMLLAFLEYYISIYWGYGIEMKAKMLFLMYWPGMIGILGGEMVRKMAWMTARTSFSHDVRTVPGIGQRLITHGVYAWFRHPAYWGWFVWALSTQLLLANPVSFVVFALVAWRFFRERIPYEEAFLVRFFGDAYLKYRSKTPTRIPGIP